MYSVIIVDDEKHCIIDLEKSIPWETYGFAIAETYRVPEEAEAGIISSQPDVVFTDIRMPRLNGLKLIENIREMGYAGEVVIVSGYDDFAYAKNAIQQGVFEYCLKPIDEEEVTEVLLKLKMKWQRNSKGKGGDKSKASDLDLPKTAGGSLLVKILDYLAMNIHRKISTSDICEQFNISRTYCTSLFQKHLGKSLTSYFTEKRMECAGKMLKETGYSVQEIASKVGMDDYYYFSKKFKGHTGMSPTEYRKQKVK